MLPILLCGRTFGTEFSSTVYSCWRSNLFRCLALFLSCFAAISGNAILDSRSPDFSSLATTSAVRKSVWKHADSPLGFCPSYKILLHGKLLTVSVTLQLHWNCVVFYFVQEVKFWLTLWQTVFILTVLYCRHGFQGAVIRGRKMAIDSRCWTHGVWHQ